MTSSHTGVRLLVFDWDGTLMDSESQIVTSLQAANRDLGMTDMSDDVCRNIIGLGLREAIEQLHPGCDAGFVEHYIDRYRHHWFQVAGESRLFPHARETLEALRDEGYQLAVATGKGRAGLDKVLQATGLEAQFAATRCSDETRSKPHPRMLQELMQQLDIPPQETLMVGDTEYDMEMARNAGAGPVAVSYGVHALERLLRHEPLGCIDSLAEFTPWLARYRGQPLMVNAE